MARVDFLLLRMDFADTRTLGSLYQGDWFLGFTCEDRDRNLELDGIKIPKQTAIPRGYYRLTVSMSKRFGKLMPELLDVPQLAVCASTAGTLRRTPRAARCSALSRPQLAYASVAT